jgi:DNA-binding beta-propeller fold protein YncE
MKRLSVVFLTMFFLLVAISAVVQAQTMDVYYAYLPASGDGSLSVVNLNTMIVEKTLPIGTGAYNINVSPKRKAVYVVNTYSKTITDINTETKIVRRSGNFGNQPYAVIVDDAENYLYVSDIADNKIYEINLNSFSKEREWTTSIQPVSLALDKQNRLWVANSGSSTVISLTDSSKTDINVGQIPFSVVFHPTKNEAYISCIGAGSY